MLVAVADYLLSTMGAVLQEGIEVAAIALILSALLPAPTHTVAMAPAGGSGLIATTSTLVFCLVQLAAEAVTW